MTIGKISQAVIAILRERGGAIELKMRYHQGAVQCLKQSIPPAARRWDPQRKAWYIDPRFEPHLVEALEAAGLEVRWATPEGGAREQPWATLFLLPGAPLAVAEAAYRALALMFHPDRQPPERRARAAEVMRKLNEAISQIRSLEERAG